MSTPLHRLPQYTLMLLKQCCPFYANVKSTSEYDEDRLPSLELFRVWLAVIPDDELDLVHLLKLAISADRPDIYDFLLDDSHPHCDVIGSPANEFPTSASAIDCAPNMAALDWWWAKHKEHDLHSKYAKAVYFAMMGYTRRDTSSRLALLMCDGPDAFDDQLEDPNPKLLRPFNIVDLLNLGSRGHVELLEFWASMVDTGLLAPIPIPDNNDDMLWNRRILDVRVLEWWLQRHHMDGLPLPPIHDLLVHASTENRIDTLDWIWQASLADLAVEFTVPADLAISRETLLTALKWWLNLHDAQDHCLALPAFTWNLDEKDTCEDVQPFWDLQSRSCAQDGTSGNCAIRIKFTTYPGSPDLRPLDWLCEHGQSITDDYSYKAGLANVFSCAWEHRRLDTLDELAVRSLSP
ncbi:hypothetical protein BC828DRAFT_395225 [Blastocladiella britannica]|nr:hypothetical protein BC828DRAFT_395225 [Blastocladiella britannica]